MRPVRLVLIALVAALLAQPARAADTLRLALQATGTTVWEMAVVSAYGLDKEADLDLKLTELASTEAGKIALNGARPRGISETRLSSGSGSRIAGSSRTA